MQKGGLPDGAEGAVTDARACRRRNKPGPYGVDGNRETATYGGREVRKRGAGDRQTRVVLADYSTMKRRGGAEARRRGGAEARRRGGAEARRRGGAEAIVTDRPIMETSLTSA